ncbi:acetyltransferase, GNAT family [Alloactinosynnema sp. L-07]|uniref:GNAT family N-acetyltransferase n=1 Tax=Alloactinosynnema sp. L-07 TaxID=1653480 RepID=UPI00065EF247|nr:GNAT family N-acetyltransferase [Alloactinosynnema sp. L-07]CRK61414.1 acetyltransferase, GNAT family [Alloactinosynnema sp. L-07]
MVTVRPFHPEDEAEIVRMRKVAFGNESPDWGVQSATWWGVVAEDDAGLCGSLRAWDYHQFFGGVAVPMAGVASVTVDPHARGRGVGGALLVTSLARMREEGQVVSTLFAATPPLYRAYGWERVGALEHVTLPPAAFGWVAKPAEPTPLRHAGAADLTGIHQLYLDIASTVDGMLDRTGPLFDTAKLLTLDTVNVVDGDGGPRGFYSTNRRPRTDTLDVHDLVARDADAGRAMLAALASWSGQVDRIQLRRCDPLVWDLLLSLPGHHTTTVEPIMLRIVDLAAAVAARGWPVGLPDFAVDLDVTDEHAPWNAGRHRLVFESGKAHVEPGGSGAVRVTARGLAAWYAGAVTVGDLRRAGLLDGDAPLLDLASRAPRRLSIADSY